MAGSGASEAGELVHVHGSVLAPAGGLAAVGGQLEAQDLEGQGQQILQAVEVAVLLVDQHQHLLRQVLRMGAGITGCREGDDPFTEPRQDGGAGVHGHCLPEGERQGGGARRVGIHGTSG